MPDPGLSRSEVEEYIAGRPAAEMIMARSIVRRTVIVGPVLLLAAGLARGRAGLVAAAIGIALVAGYYLLSGALLSGLAKVSLGAYHAGALLGFLIRLGLITATMFVLAALFDLDRMVLGLTVLATYMVLLLWEAGAGGPRRRAQASSAQGARGARKKKAKKQERQTR